MESNGQTRSRRDEYTEATRLALLAAGRDAFTTQGYRAAGVEVISRAARVTRGAFYHHFADKAALFDAVVVELQVAAAAKVERAAKAHPAIWDRLDAGIEAYLDACLEPDYGRIVIHEAPTVLGNQRFREIEEQYPMALLMATLSALERRGELRFDDVDLLSRMVDAMICKVAILLPDADDPTTLRNNARQAIGAFLGTFRTA